jgi:hypothetical protein
LGRGSSGEGACGGDIDDEASRGFNLLAERELAGRLRRRGGGIQGSAAPRRRRIAVDALLSRSHRIAAGALGRGVRGGGAEVVAGAVGSGTREGGEKAALRLGVQAAVLCAWRSMPMRGCAMTV